MRALKHGARGREISFMWLEFFSRYRMDNERKFRQPQTQTYAYASECIGTNHTFCEFYMFIALYTDAAAHANFLR